MSFEHTSKHFFLSITGCNRKKFFKELLEENKIQIEQKQNWIYLNLSILNTLGIIRFTKLCLIISMLNMFLKEDEKQLVIKSLKGVQMKNKYNQSIPVKMAKSVELLAWKISKIKIILPLYQKRQVRQVSTLLLPLCNTTLDSVIILKVHSVVCSSNKLSK